VSDDWSDDERSTHVARSARQERDSLVLVDASGTRHALDRSVTLGSSKSAEIRVEGATVSRLHARIERNEHGTLVHDLERTNGTFVDGVRVIGATLRPGARIGLGDVTLRIDAHVTREKIALWPDERFGPLLGRSVVMRALFERIARAAKTESTVLVTGETGTGKELVARALHDASPRKNRPFVVVDSGAIPEALFESELFGHVRGAFTGADRQRDGAVQSAEGGTLFLDEVGELPLALQPKLLRVLESRMSRRVGETTQHPVDVRVVAATHRDLARMVAVGAFREDLWFRLAVLPIEVPPLRDRKEDIPLLATHLAKGHELEASVLAEMTTRAWLGNVRELRNFVERAVTFGADDALRGSRSGAEPASFDLSDLSTDRPYRAVKDELLDALERRYLEALLTKTKWNVSAVAEAMDMNRSHVHRLLKKHGLSR
jgi:transcriptional regulator with GAF, ATPase, and Fis domain